MSNALFYYYILLVFRDLFICMEFPISNNYLENKVSIFFFPTEVCPKSQGCHSYLSWGEPNVGNVGKMLTLGINKELCVDFANQLL